ncbi:hypothetical protein D5086_007588 [Populus alba]|uniref:Uncharacterized protein n=1 Tax=Populus alba TaxID=43335 RepID=A0ACC4CQ15_POPAL
MEGSFAKELYSESLQLSNAELGSKPIANDDSVEELDRESDLDREWQRRHDQFHTIGYRDGLIAGKEDSAQEGFNVGFKQSVLVGYNWGVVRGVTRKKAMEQRELEKASSDVARMNKDDSSCCSDLENYVGELQSLLLDSPAIKSHLSVKQLLYRTE